MYNGLHISYFTKRVITDEYLCIFKTELITIKGYFCTIFRFSVRLGEHDLRTEEDCDDGEPGLEYCSSPPIDIEVEEKVVHKDYNSKAVRYDIALLRLKHKVNYTGIPLK